MDVEKTIAKGSGTYIIWAVFLGVMRVQVLLLYE